VTAADNIIVLAGDGTVEDQGTHAQLMERGGQYAQFWTQRVAATGWTMAASE
jgi:ATP-binding cassette, subfamily B, bacterial IrtB/YbtQ